MKMKALSTEKKTSSIQKGPFSDVDPQSCLPNRREKHVVAAVAVQFLDHFLGNRQARS